MGGSSRDAPCCREPSTSSTVRARPGAASGRGFARRAVLPGAFDHSTVRARPGAASGRVFARRAVLPGAFDHSTVRARPGAVEWACLHATRRAAGRFRPLRRWPGRAREVPHVRCEVPHIVQWPETDTLGLTCGIEKLHPCSSSRRHAVGLKFYLGKVFPMGFGVVTFLRGGCRDRRLPPRATHRRRPDGRDAIDRCARSQTAEPPGKGLSGRREPPPASTSGARTTRATRWGAAVISTGVCLGLVLTGTPAGAQPGAPAAPSAADVAAAKASALGKAAELGQVKAQLAAADARERAAGIAAESAAEDYNGAALALADAKAAATKARAAATRARADADARRAVAGQFAASSYQQTNGLAGVNAFMSADGPGTLLDTAATLSMVDSSLAQAYAAYRAAQSVAAAKQSVAATAQATADAAATAQKAAYDVAKGRAGRSRCRHRIGRAPAKRAHRRDGPPRGHQRRARRAATARARGRSRPACRGRSGGPGSC